MRSQISSLATALFLSEGLKRNFAAAQNEVAWYGMELGDDTTVSRELKGQTNWILNRTGKEQTLTFELGMVLNQFTGDLPQYAGIIWAMPTADSIPADLEFEVGAFLNGTEEGSQTKTQINFKNEGKIHENFYKLGFRQTWIFHKETQIATYAYDSQGAVTEVANEITVPHWKLNANKSQITPTYWQLTFSRTDTETLGLKQGKEMTCLMALMDSLEIEAVNKGVMLRWQFREHGVYAQADHATTLQTMAGLTSLAALASAALLI